MKISYKAMVKKKLKVAILRFVNLKSLIVPTHIQIVMKSEIIQFLSENHQPSKTPNPTRIPMTSIILTCSRLNKLWYFLIHFILVK